MSHSQELPVNTATTFGLNLTILYSIVIKSCCNINFLQKINAKEKQEDISIKGQPPVSSQIEGGEVAM